RPQPVAPEAGDGDGEGPDSEDPAEDQPRDEEVRKRTAGEDRRVELHDGSVRRRDEGRATGQSADAEQDEPGDRHEPGSVQLRTRDERMSRCRLPVNAPGTPP